MPVTTRTIANTAAGLVRPDGSAVAGVVITFSLRDAVRCPTDAWDAYTHERIAGVKTATTDSNGCFTINLWPNDRGTAATWYLVSCDDPAVAPFEAALASGNTALTWLEFMALGHEVTPVELDLAQSVVDGSVTDAKIGLRAIVPAVLSALTGTVTDWLQGIVYQLKRIIGETNWYDAPDVSLHDAGAHIDSAAPHDGHLAADGSVKLTGPIQAAGGDVRGADANDLQLSRSSSTQVASGTHSLIAGGSNNTAGGSHAVLPGGYANQVSGAYGVVGGGYGNSAGGEYGAVGGGATNNARAPYAAVGGGQSNDAYAEHSFVGGGESNVADGAHATVGGGKANNTNAQYGTVGGGYNNATGTAMVTTPQPGVAATVAGGDSNVAYGDCSAVGGGQYNAAMGEGSVIAGGQANQANGDYSGAGGLAAVAALYGQHSQAAGCFVAEGDAQASAYVLRGVTANATPVALHLDGSTERLTVPANSVFAFRALVVASTAGGAKVAGYELVGVVANAAGTVALSGLAKTVLIETDAGWDVTAAADNTNKALLINVTGGAADTVRWVATVWTSEVGFPAA